jgi:hypothetical protein
MKKNTIIFLSLFFFSFSVHAQINCNNTSVGFPPLNDLGPGTWNGYQGGLYPNGSNYRPAAHNAAGLAIANQIKPLDGNGNVDLVNGKVVWMSIGMSNTSLEASTFIKKADSIATINPKLKMIDGAVFGCDIDAVDTSVNYWNIVMQRLVDSGLTAQQVQVIWFKETKKNPTDPIFPNFSNEVLGKLKIAMNVLKIKFPNVKICYLDSRIYGGYAMGTLNPEPYAWYSGWAVKWLIAAQLNNDPGLVYSGSNPNSPWLSWGPYLWADGLTPRSDGLTWLCSDLLQNDGVHPSTPQGRQKVATLLKQFFITDSTSVPWFLASSTSMTEYNNGGSISLFPNPSTGLFSIEGNDIRTVRLFDLAGQELFIPPSDQQKNKSGITLDLSSFPKAIYLIEATTIKGMLLYRKIILE